MPRGVAVSFRDLSYEVPIPTTPSKHPWIPRLLRKAAASPVDEENQLSDTDKPRNQRKRLLKEISADVNPGEALAMSASGVGKRSLLTLLSGRAEYPPCGGEILFDRRPRTSRTRQSIGFVTQDDVFLSRLTVRQTLEFQASIVLPDRDGPDARRRAVDDVLGRLMLEKCEHTKIGASVGCGATSNAGVSGGERKSLNIATELLASPELLLLDEPTSNLDTSTALSVVKVLRSYADDGTTVIASIHQPSPEMLALFDKVLLLSEGDVVWFGRTPELQPYFESMGYSFPRNYNPYDYVMRLLVDLDFHPASLLIASSRSSVSDTFGTDSFFASLW